MEDLKNDITRKQEIIKKINEDFENLKRYSDNLKTEVSSLRKSLYNNDNEIKNNKNAVIELEKENKVK